MRVSTTQDEHGVLTLTLPRTPALIPTLTPTLSLAAPGRARRALPARRRALARGLPLDAPRVARGPRAAAARSHPPRAPTMSTHHDHPSMAMSMLTLAGRAGLRPPLARSGPGRHLEECSRTPRLTLSTTLTLTLSPTSPLPEPEPEPNQAGSSGPTASSGTPPPRRRSSSSRCTTTTWAYGAWRSPS